ncbi:MAG: four helix bundle protein [Bacteroidales bacterium 45-6]|nr:MAG: four helix bundle protein [Bacteroidales bacterium 45-6]
MDYNTLFQTRTKELALAIIRQLSKVKYSDEVSVIRKQIFRSATSVAANYRAVARARSENERYAKICIVVEEIDETTFWLEIIKELDIIAQDDLSELIVEAEELLKVMASYRKKMNDKKSDR